MPKRPARRRSVEELRPHLVEVARVLRAAKRVLRAILRQLPAAGAGAGRRSKSEAQAAEELASLVEEVIVDALEPAIATLERTGRDPAGAGGTAAQPGARGREVKR